MAATISGDDRDKEEYLHNISEQRLSTLPTFGLESQHITTLFAKGNRISELPTDLASVLPHLKIFGIGFNRLTEIRSGTVGPSLQALIATNNRIASADLSAATGLVKCMLSHNELHNVPSGLATMPHIEVIRLGDNPLEKCDIPELGPNLAMLGIAPRLPSGEVPEGLTVYEEPATPAEVGTPVVGKGSSGEATVCHRSSVVVKRFVGVPTDGQPEAELRAHMAAYQVDVPFISEPLHALVDPATGDDDEMAPRKIWGFGMRLHPGKLLGDPPNLKTLTRCNYNTNDFPALAPDAIRAIATQLAASLAALHDKAGVLVGDIYAHNVLWDGTNITLLDFGAASCGHAAASPLFRADVLGFGRLITELMVPFRDLSSAPGVFESTSLFPVAAVLDKCLAADPLQRPTMSEVLSELSKIR
jgi:hypothetical protein